MKGDFFFIYSVICPWRLMYQQSKAEENFIWPLHKILIWGRVLHVFSIVKTTKNLAWGAFSRLPKHFPRVWQWVHILIAWGYVCYVHMAPDEFSTGWKSVRKIRRLAVQSSMWHVLHTWPQFIESNRSLPRCLGGEGWISWEGN